MSERTPTIDPSRFDAEVLGSSGPVLVDFQADWCAPCRALAPVLDELAEEFDGRLAIRKIDVDQSPSIAERYGVRSIPALRFFQDGALVDQATGALPKETLRDRIERLLA